MMSSPCESSVVLGSIALLRALLITTCLTTVIFLRNNCLLFSLVLLVLYSLHFLGEVEWDMRLKEK